MAAAQSRGRSAETTVDQALIRGLATAFRVCVSGLAAFLKSGRRAEPGHVVSDGGSPPWLHPRPCAAGWQAEWLGVSSSSPLRNHDVKFLCSIGAPFLRPDLVTQGRRAQPRSRLAGPKGRATAVRRLGLEGGE